jgi:sec-independent protein translocase protein TatC
MSRLCPEEPGKLNIVSHLEELRSRVLYCLSALICGTAVSFSMGRVIMGFVKRPISGLTGELIFISPTEAFVAYMKVVLLAGFVISFPFLLYQIWAFLSPAAKKNTRRRIALWFWAALVLFFIGTAFSYFAAIPRALDFLLGFGGKIASPKISLGKYISFFNALILTGGIIFELPVFIGLLADAGFVNTRQLKKKRHIAILAILTFAAIITPTQDVFNMLLFAVPMIVLYELSIFVAIVIGKVKNISKKSAANLT